MDATPASTLPSIEQSFTIATELVTTALGNGIHPTAAGLKSQMLLTIEGFTERHYGYRKFLDYLRAAEAAGHLVIQMDPVSGHPRLSLPAQAPMVPVVSRFSPHRRLRSDLWATFVSWDRQSARIWDRSTHRAHLVPLDDEGNPLWQNDHERFVEIEPVTMETHLGWMRDFAGRQEDGDARAALEASLESDPLSHSFKKALVDHDLNSAWATVLRTCVMNHALEWASAREVPISTLLDPRRTVITSKPSPAAPSTPGGDAMTAPPATAPAPAPLTIPEADALRVRLHAVVDRMSLAELAALQIPAGYLLS
jgi:hypothetical protein